MRFVTLSLFFKECNSLREQLHDFTLERKTSSQLIKEAVAEENKKAKVLKDAIREMTLELKDKNNTISRLEERCIDAEAIADRAVKELNDAKIDNERIRERNHTLSQEKAITEDNLSLAKRRILQLNDKIIDLQGNIRVFCRVRPVSLTDIERVGSTEAELAMLIRYIDRDVMEFNSTTFEFDRIFPPTSSQVEVFDEVYIQKYAYILFSTCDNFLKRLMSLGAANCTECVKRLQNLYICIWPNGQVIWKELYCEQTIIVISSLSLVLSAVRHTP